MQALVPEAVLRRLAHEAAKLTFGALRAEGQLGGIAAWIARRDATVGMDSTLALRTHPAFAVGTLLAALVISSRAIAQACSNQGSTPIAASLEASPLYLGCTGAGQWPQWHLLTPAHRAPVPHAGFDPGDATARPRLLVAWRCTGWLLVPVLPSHVTVMGYVLDRAEFACAPTTP
jgi:hypothetical protein